MKTYSDYIVDYDKYGGFDVVLVCQNQLFHTHRLGLVVLLWLLLWLLSVALPYSQVRIVVVFVVAAVVAVAINFSTFTG